MTDNNHRARPSILFLFSDTGGGHRSATEAVIEALHLEFGERIQAVMVDIFKEYAPLPLNRIPQLYPHMVRAPRAWGLGFRLSDGYRRSHLMTAGAWPYVRNRIRKLVQQHASDLVVSVHPLAISPVLKALGANRPPFITLVTDLVSTHALWYDRRTDLCLVPTQMARQRALEFGLRPDQVQVVGLPVADDFCHPAADKKLLRARLGWPEALPVILLVGGGEGMGPLGEISEAIAAAHLPVALAIITGRNKDLKAHLEARKWDGPTFIYGFMRNMPDLMRAADVLVTKAGPGTISEAFNAGLPLILYSRLPGQEDGNVTYVTARGAGVWAPKPEKVVATIKTWLKHPEERQKATEASKRLARPEAARVIARILAQELGVE
jgi:1,2-diacylglycerol 3-beta-galactosyltransferase